MQASRLLLYASPCTSHPSVPVAVYHYCFAVVKVQQAGLVASTLGAQPHTKDYLATQLPHNKHHKRGSRRTTAKFKLCDDEADAAQLPCTYIHSYLVYNNYKCKPTIVVVPPSPFTVNIGPRKKYPQPPPEVLLLLTGTAVVATEAG